MATQITVITGTGSASYTVSTGARGPAGVNGSDATVTANAVTAVLDDNAADNRTALGLGTAATTAATAYATAAQGTLAGTALQPSAIASSTITPKTGALNLNAVGTAETWVFEGDSWTAGTAQGNDRETWPYYIARFAPATVSFVNVALAGTTAQTMVSTFAAQVEPNLTATTGKATTCFIFGGINDAGVPRTTTQVRDDLRSLWTSARNAGARVVAFALPHRTAAGGWSQADWLTINNQIIADSTYYDVLVRTDIVFPNTSSGEYTDGLHVTTAAHQKFASRIMDSLTGRQVMPSVISDMVCNAVTSATLAANTRKNLGFSAFSYEAGGDYSIVTVGSDANTMVFTCPVNGTYEIYAEVCLSGLSSGDTAFMNGWITPLATGVEVEHRMDYTVAAGANPTLKGFIRRRLLRGDKINISVQTSRASATLLTNTNNADFTVRLVSIP